MDGLDGFDCEGASCFGAVQNYRLPDAEPIFDVGCRAGLSPSIDVSVGFTDEQVSICCKDVVTF